MQKMGRKMPNSNYKNWETFISRTKIYLIIIALLIIALCVLNYKLILPGIIIYALIILYTLWSNKKRKAELSEQLKDLTLNVNTTAKTTLINSPFPLVIIETNGNVIWKSEKFVTEFENMEINTNEYLTEIIKHGEIIELNITNKPDNPDINVEKEGIIQTTANQEIKYDFKIQNTGNVPLDNFTWYDFLPTDYVTVTKLVTGTYNQDLNYAIYYKTNKNDYRLLRDNLNTQVNNYIDFSNLELEENEYVTEFKAEFGTVDVGFTSVESPQLFVKVKSTVKNDDTFTNKTKVDGYHKTYYVWDEDDHTTKVYEKKLEVKLPRTGC